MITTHSLPPLDASIKTAVTIGTFDGVHLGHTQIIKQLVEKAKILKIITEYLVKYTNSRSICYACNIVDDVLVLGATNSSNLSLARNYQHEILKDINSKFYNLLSRKLKKIKFKIIKNPKI